MSRHTQVCLFGTITRIPPVVAFWMVCESDLFCKTTVISQLLPCLSWVLTGEEGLTGNFVFSKLSRFHIAHSGHHSVNIILLKRGM